MIRYSAAMLHTLWLHMIQLKYTLLGLHQQHTGAGTNNQKAANQPPRNTCWTACNAIIMGGIRIVAHNPRLN